MNIGDALRAAGYRTAQERLAALAAEVLAAGDLKPAPDNQTNPAARARLKQVAEDAVRANPRNWDGARDALLRAVRNDAALLWEMFAPFRNQAVQMLLTDAAAAVRRETQAREGQRGGAGRCSSDDRGVAARPSTPRNAPATGQGGGAGHIRPGDRFSRAGAAAVAAAARRSLLDSFLINGRPIGDATPREAEAWAASRERDARFVRRLTENLPLDAPIRRFRTAEETERAYAEAEGATHAH